MCALSGVQYLLNQSFGEALTPSFMAINVLKVHFFRSLEMYDLFDPEILVYLVNKM